MAEVAQGNDSRAVAIVNLETHIADVVSILDWEQIDLDAGTIQLGGTKHDL